MLLGICDLKSQCSFVVNEIDKFTNTRKIETKLEVLHRDFNSTLGFSFCNYDSLFFVKVNMNFSDLIYSIQKGSEMILITEKGNKLILSSLENELVSGFSEISYLIKVDDLKKLRDERITDVRVYFIDSHIDKVIEYKRADKVMSLCRCI